MHDDVAVIIWRETSFRSTRPTLEQKRAGDELVVLVLTRPGFLGGKSAFWRETGRLITQTPNYRIFLGPSSQHNFILSGDKIRCICYYILLFGILLFSRR